jgi:hypothetical protein
VMAVVIKREPSPIKQITAGAGNLTATVVPYADKSGVKIFTPANAFGNLSRDEFGRFVDALKELHDEMVGQ